MEHYQHPQALVETAEIGKNTRIWAFAHILPHAKVGAECNICDNVFIENDVEIGDRVTIKCGVQLWDGLRVENDVFIGPNVTFANDNFPRSKKRPDHFLTTIIRSGASIGSNATILGGIVVGRKSMIGAGAVVTSDVPPNAIVMGNPARITGYVDSDTGKRTLPSILHKSLDVEQRSINRVKKVNIVYLPKVTDLRGSLSFAEYGQLLPFLPKRYFIVYDVPSKDVRGQHAHRKLHQFLICVNGSCSVVVDDGQNRDEIILDSPAMGIHIPPMIWATQYKYTDDAILLVFASEIYDPSDYIRDYDEYQSELSLTDQ